MKLFRSASVVLPLYLVACATAVTQDLDEEPAEGEPPSSGSGGMAGSTTISEGGKAGSTTTGKAGSGSIAFGGSATSGGAGTAGTGGKASGGSAGSSSAGSGGKASGGSGGASAGSGGTGSGGKAGSNAGGSAGAGGTGVVVGTGSCSGTPAFALGASTKYAAGAKVVATCNGGTPCSLAKPAGQNGKQYEFSCTDQYNCGGQDPAISNWAQPPWNLTKVCE